MTKEHHQLRETYGDRDYVVAITTRMPVALTVCATKCSYDIQGGSSKVLSVYQHIKFIQSTTRECHVQIEEELV